MKNKFKIIWHYWLYPSNIFPHDSSVIKTEIVDADSIKDVNAISILTEEEKKKYEIDIKMCLRVLYCDDPDYHVIDYGSHSKFITIIKLNSEKEQNYEKNN